VLASSGETLYKRDVVIQCLTLLGGVWIVSAFLMKLIPKIIRDKCYDFVGFVRYKLAGKVDVTSCQLLPEEYRRKIVL